MIAADLVPERLDELRSHPSTADIVTITADISEEEDVQRLVDAAAGRIDLLANVAGVMDRFQPVHELDDAVWEHVLKVNVTGTMRLSRAVLPHMLRAGTGSIVNVASEAGLRGSAAGVAYTASKHAVIGITKSSSVMYAPLGIRVNAVAPGAVTTNIVSVNDSEFARERLGHFKEHVTPPSAEPEALAAAITWLLSDDSANVSGIVLASDGGWSAI